MRVPSTRLEWNKTIFVGALHGMLSAEDLAEVINDLFDNVIYAEIDTDKHKYPIGAFQILMRRNLFSNWLKVHTSTNLYSFALSNHRVN